MEKMAREKEKKSVCYVYFVPNSLIPSMTSLLAVLPAITVLTIGMILFAGLAWIMSYRGFAGRLHYTILTLSALAFIWWLNYWHVLGGYWICC